MNNDHVFGNWEEAAANAGRLLDAGHIDVPEYHRIIALAQKERASRPAQAAPGQAQPAPGQVATPAQNPPDLGPSASGRAEPLGTPMQSLPTWDQVQRFLREIMGPRSAY
jgi:hypothetical protein